MTDFSRLLTSAPINRLPMLKGRVDPKATTATSYAWLVWIPAHADRWTEFRWIAPCRKRLDRAEDYAEVRAP